MNLFFTVNLLALEDLFITRFNNRMFLIQSGCCSLLSASCWLVGHLGRTGFLDWLGIAVALQLTYCESGTLTTTLQESVIFYKLNFLSVLSPKFSKLHGNCSQCGTQLLCVKQSEDTVAMIFILLPWFCVYPILFFLEWWTNWFWFKIRRFDFWQVV